MIILVIFAFLSGVVTVLSPCILPVLPILLASGFGQGKYRPLGIIFGFVLSFGIFILLLATAVRSIGISPDFLRYIAIILIIFFGLLMLSNRLEQMFSRFTDKVAKLGNLIQTKSSFFGSGFLSGFLFGTSIGFIWTPCAGPVLATIIVLIATTKITFQTIILTLAYSLGTALPMFLIAYGGNKILQATSFLSGYTEIIKKVFGVLMILGALSIAFHFDIILQQITLRYLPNLSIENNTLLKKELEKLKPTRNISIHAPDFAGIAAWINSNPLTMKELRGKVVLIDFWTYSCINCVRTLPYIKDWYSKYKDKNFIIVGVHTPEFEFEKKLSNVKDAVKRFGIEYPVALDNNYQTWMNYDNHYWPAHYLVDQNGIINKIHFGEGSYDEMENAIRNLLGLEPISAKSEKLELKNITPETYLGYLRAQSYVPEISVKNDQNADYQYKNELQNNQVGLVGTWLFAPEFIESKNDNAILDINFIAKNVYLVMESDGEKAVDVLLDGKPLERQFYTKDMNGNGQIIVNESRMYDILNLKEGNTRHKLRLIFPTNVKVYVFTFG